MMTRVECWRLARPIRSILRPGAPVIQTRPYAGVNRSFRRNGGTKSKVFGFRPHRKRVRPAATWLAIAALLTQFVVPLVFQPARAAPAAGMGQEILVPICSSHGIEFVPLRIGSEVPDSEDWSCPHCPICFSLHPVGKVVPANVVLFKIPILVELAAYMELYEGGFSQTEHRPFRARAPPRTLTN